MISYTPSMVYQSWQIVGLLLRICTIICTLNSTFHIFLMAANSCQQVKWILGENLLLFGSMLNEQSIHHSHYNGSFNKSALLLVEADVDVEYYFDDLLEDSRSDGD